MFSQLVRKAEVSVDNAIGDFFGRLLIALSFIVAVGFAAASISSMVNRTYGSEAGNLILAAGFCVLGLVIAVVVRVRSRTASLAAKAETEKVAPAAEEEPYSIFDDDALMAVASSAAPIVLPALLRTAMKNWHILLAALAAAYVMSRPDAPAVQPGE